MIRIQSYPWLGYDHRIPVDVSRALAIGAQFVMVSHSGKREIEDCLSLAGDWHRKALWLHPYKSFDDWDTVTEEMKEGTFIIPQPETIGALADLDETLTMPGVKMLFFSMGDLSKLLSGTVALAFRPRPAALSQELLKRHGAHIGPSGRHATVPTRHGPARRFPTIGIHFGPSDRVARHYLIFPRAEIRQIASILPRRIPTISSCKCTVLSE